MNKIYNLTGIKEAEEIIICQISDQGKEMIICSENVHGAMRGDVILLDRPHFKKCPFKVEGVRYIEEKPDYRLLYLRLIEEHLGGYQKPLRLKFKKSTNV